MAKAGYRRPVRGVPLVVALAACSGGGGAPPDGPGSDTSCGSDRDGDGHCDRGDVCPDVYDPAQLDSDRDGLGWACDPVETFSFDTPYQVYASGMISSKKLALFAPLCEVGYPCEQTVVSADQASIWIARTSSGDSSEDWLASGLVEQAIITADHQALISRRLRSDFNDGDTRAVDPTTKSTAERGPLIARYIREGRGAPILLSFGDLPSALVEPRNGNDLHTIASGQGSWLETLNSAFAESWATESPPFISMGAYPAAPAWTLQRYAPSSSTLEQLTPAVTAATLIGRVLPVAGTSWCVQQGTSVTLYTPTAAAVQVTSVPFSQCGMQSYPFADTQLLVGLGFDVDGNGTAGSTAVFVRDGVAHDVFQDYAPQGAGRLRMYGRDVIVVEWRPDSSSTPSKVWAIWPDNTVSVLAVDLAAVDISVGGDTIHVIGVANGGTLKGPLVVRRYRQGAASESSQLVAETFTSSEIHIVTSAEGAAIASTLANGWVAPSSSLTFTAHPELDRVTGGARRDHTILFSRVGSFDGAPYAYDEVAGTPRLTRLAPDKSDFNGELVEILGSEPSEYFATAPSCAFGRIRPSVDGTPTLVATPCAFAGTSRLEVVGRTPEGETLIADTLEPPPGRYRLSALGETGVRSIANGANVIPIYDRTTNPPTMRAWIASDNFEGYACVEETPLRCWSVPGQVNLVDSRIENDVISLLLFERQGTVNRFAVVHTIGPGNAQLP
jgi:hypothetical protein